MVELGKLLVDHFVGEETVLRLGGYPKAANTIRNSLPTTKRTQSGDLGELIATEYVDAKTPFVVPIRKLRWKSDRKMPMHGNDVIALQRQGRVVRVLKGEAKSAGALSRATVKGAVEGLDRDDGRPNPSTLAFIAKRLYEAGRDAEGKIFNDLQAKAAIAPKNICHLIFAFTGRDPSKLLAALPKPKRAGIQRIVAAVVISGHGDFVKVTYAIHGAEA
jgi:hypothetical protein